MSIDQRQTPRIHDFAKACMPELTKLPGFLEDVSKTGCKVRFTDTFEIDMDQEYTLTVQPSLRSGIKGFDLVVSPQWARTETDSMEIGFFVLHCPGTCPFNKYVDILASYEVELIQEA
jgi:hypothetical protein